MNHSKQEDFFAEDEEEGFLGLDFSRLNKRWESEELPWDYMGIIKKYLRDEHFLLDIGTGSGEFLLRLNHPYERTSVTEAWEPNLKVCKERLEPLGIHVKRVTNEKLTPFCDNSFDFVIDRHEPYEPKELFRVLKPGGMFITQQIGWRNNEMLSRIMAPCFKIGSSDRDLKSAEKAFEGIGFEVVFCGEYFPKIKFYDIGVAIFFAKIMEWEFFGLSSATHKGSIDRLRMKLNENGYIESAEHRYIIAARKR